MFNKFNIIIEDTETHLAQDLIGAVSLLIILFVALTLCLELIRMVANTHLSRYRSCDQ